MIEDGAYRRLLDLYYTREAPLPANLDAVCRLIRARTDDERAAVMVVLDEFFARTDDGYRHKRCDEEIERAKEKREKARASGIASGMARRAYANAERTLSERSANAERTTNETRTLQSPISNLQSPDTEEGASPPAPPAEKGKRKIGTRIPDDFDPGEDGRAYALKHLPNVDVDAFIEEFRNFWKAAAGASARKNDWVATFKVRVLNCQRYPMKPVAARQPERVVRYDTKGNVIP